MARARPILWDVMEEHLEEAAFLRAAWERALASPAFTVGMVAAGPEERLLAHLDALRVGGPAVDRRLLTPALAGDDPDLAFTAAWVVLEEGGVARAVEALQAAEGPGRTGIRRALELSPRPGVERALAAAAAAGPVAARAAALEALAFRGLDPGEALGPALKAAEPPLRTAALRAARHCRAPWVAQAVAAELSSKDPAALAAAVETGLVLGVREAWPAGARLASGAVGPAPGWALLLAALGGEAADHAPLLTAAAMPAPRPEALFALGFAGTVAAADACAAAAWSEDERVARLAGEAFSAITGLAIAPPFEALPEAASAELVPLEREALDADLDAGPEGDLPLPDPVGLAAWWKRSRPGLDPAIRHLGGRPLDGAALASALERGPTRRRHALALDAEIRSHGARRLQTRGWARGQRPPEGLLGLDLSRPYRALVRGG